MLMLRRNTRSMRCSSGTPVSTMSPPTRRMVRMRFSPLQQEAYAEYQRPWFEKSHIADHAHQDAGLQQRLGDRHADEAADRLGLGHDHRGVGTDFSGVLRGGLLAYAFLMERTPQRPHRILAHPSAIDVEGELET